MPDERSVGAVVYRLDEQGHRRYLLLHYQAGHWGHVKGHIEEGETHAETLHREAEEETGLTDLELVDGFHEVVTYTFQRGQQPVDKRVDIYLAQTTTKAVVVNAPDEHQEVVWLGYREAMERLTYPESKRVLEAAEAHLDGGAQQSLDDW